MCFLVAHTPSSAGMPPLTSYTLITRAAPPQTGFMFQKLPELCPPFGLDRASPYQFMQRLKDFPPNLSDAIVVASTGSEDVGLVTRSKTPLATDVPADQIIDVFTTTTMADDSRRAQMPMSEELSSTSPIGVALDLSSKDRIPRPLPKEEFDQSPGPLPALMILNNEGVLAAWWMVYADSIRQGTTFPGLAIAGGSQAPQSSQDQRQVSPFASSGPPTASAFGQSAFGKPSNPQSLLGGATDKPTTAAFGAPNAPKSVFGSSVPAFGSTSTAGGVFGSAAPASAFGAPSALGSAFGSAPALGKPQSPWVAQSNSAPSASTGAPAFGQPSFGSSTPMGGSTSGLAFGQAGGLARSSPWGTLQGGSAAAIGSTFGQTGSLGMRASSFGGASTGAAFGSTPATENASAAPSGGFASFAAKPSGFMAAGTAPAQSVFGKPSSGSAFGSVMDTGSPFGQPPKQAGTPNPFGQPVKKDEAPKSVFGGGSGFTLGSTFKSDGTAANDAPKPIGNAASSMFGSSFGDTLGKTRTDAPQIKDADMDDDVDDDSEDKFKEQPAPKDTAPSKDTAEPATKAASPFPQTAPPASGGLFGTQSQSKITPAEVQTSKPATFSFGRPTPATTTPKESPAKPKDVPPVKTSPKIKAEPESDDDAISPLNEDEALTPPRSKTPETSNARGSKTPDAPLPPESTSKASFAPGDSSNSSKSSAEEPAEPPLPPDPLPSKSKLSKAEPAPAEQTELPDEVEYEGLDDEGSGVDVAQEFSSPSDQNQSPKISPESSFGFPKSPVGGLFANAAQQAKPEVRPLFGEVDKASSTSTFGKPSAPFFPLPTQSQHSPRSPSPVRQVSQLSVDSLRPENSRSVSAPGPLKAISNRKNQLTIPSKQSQPSTIELRKQQEQRVANERAKQVAEEEQSLSDDEDEQVRRELETPVAGSRFLDPFLAHQDYVGNIDKPGIPGQIEKVYRDINSMVDTLGLNARSLTAFVKGHTEQLEGGERTKDDFEHGDDWSLNEIADLQNIESQLVDHLERHSLQGVPETLSTCRDIRKDIQSLRHKRNDMTKAIEMRKDPEIIESAISAPLSLEQASQQHDLRKKFTHFQKLLAQAEEDITMLRAKLASCETSRPGSRDGRAQPVKKPTVEAVTKTILKMTSMVEKQSGDIDVLEAQLRDLRLPSVDGQSSREGSPFAASTSRKVPGFKKGSVLGKSLQSGNAQHSSTLRRSLNGDGSPKNGSEGMAAKEVQLYREKAKRRREVNQLVRQAFEKTGPRIRAFE